VCTFRHALALDERRAKFEANLWNRPLKEEELLGISEQKLVAKQQQQQQQQQQPLPHQTSGESTTIKDQHAEQQQQPLAHQNSGESTKDQHENTLMVLEGKYQKQRQTPTDVDEVRSFETLASIVKRLNAYYYYDRSGLLELMVVSHTNFFHFLIGINSLIYFFFFWKRCRWGLWYVVFMSTTSIKKHISNP